MNGQFRFLVLVQAAVTFALLAFAYMLRGQSPGVAEIVVGAALAHWLRESVSLGQAEREDTKGMRAQTIAERLADRAERTAIKVDEQLVAREAAVAERAARVRRHEQDAGAPLLKSRE